MSTFANAHTHSLVLDTVPKAPPTPPPEVDDRKELNRDEAADENEKIYALLLTLKPPLDKNAARIALKSLENSQIVSLNFAGTAKDDEAEILGKALQGRLLVALYAEALDMLLQEARDADAEAEWWSDLARSWQSVAWYLVQTFPERLKRCFETIVRELRSHHIPVQLNSFSPKTIRSLFPSGLLHPSALTASFFPHISRQTHSLFTSPLELARQECIIRKTKLEVLRNSRAEALGHLFKLKRSIASELQAPSTQIGLGSYPTRIRKLLGDTNASETDVLQGLSILAFQRLPQHASTHTAQFSSLCRPSRLTRLWPRLVVIPPVTLLLFRYIYRSRESLHETAVQAADTVRGFWFGYVVEPVRGILDTVRTGGEDGPRIVSMEGVKADLESLERMALDLSKDKLGYTPSQLEALSEQVRHGDLTPVLKVYEQDIKSPIRSVVTGSLVRSLLIQVQKAKVDLDQALTGIDKLLKSQELTFGFVGVAPALGILYATIGFLRNVLFGSRGKNRYGNRRWRECAWTSIRRVERVLISKELYPDAAQSIPPLTLGLLLISVSHLRTYAETCLPPLSRLREGFLEDVADLEDLEFGRDEKRMVVDRMWRSWGVTLGWTNMAALRKSALPGP
ncbi:NCA2-domain-containing protein [Rickenella mellea]|uniref:NCA2-domain-containing protein n=1 Tax=Rickenella mellea TaxID=50990 RepID=A0A4Y7Q853_9AGAM|nr:NCA2-domain-containing protein [Rickenella mellea]